MEDIGEVVDKLVDSGPGVSGAWFVGDVVDPVDDEVDALGDAVADVANVDDWPFAKVDSRLLALDLRRIVDFDQE